MRSKLLIGIRSDKNGKKEYLHVENDGSVTFSISPKDASVLTNADKDEYSTLKGIKFIYPLDDHDVCNFMYAESK